MLASRPGVALRLDEPWAQPLLDLLPTGRVTSLPRPVSAFMICPRDKLLYAPIAKCACTSLKHLMVELNDLEHAELILQGGVHRVTDAFITGVQLKDHDRETVLEALNSEQYYRFAVIREPVRRVISAYTEKLLRNRLSKGNLVHTLDPIRVMTCESNPDLARGVSFRQFVEYLVGNEPAHHDPHWTPQHLFLDGVSRYDDIFTMEQLDQLEARLREHTGRDISLGQHNRSLKPETELPGDTDGRYADLLPQQLDDIEGISARDFMAPDLVRRLEAYYAQDVDLYRGALKGLRNHVPAAVDLDRPGGLPESYVMSTAPEIARCTNLYCKGYFVVSEEGQSQLSIIIDNTMSLPMDFSALPSCHFVYTARNAGGDALHTAVTPALELPRIPPNGSHRLLLPVTFPPEMVDEIGSVIVALRFGDAFNVADVSPVHIASAQRVAN